MSSLYFRTDITFFLFYIYFIYFLSFSFFYKNKLGKEISLYIRALRSIVVCLVKLNFICTMVSLSFFLVLSLKSKELLYKVKINFFSMIHLNFATVAFNQEFTFEELFKNLVSFFRFFRSRSKYQNSSLSGVIEDFIGRGGIIEFAKTPRIPICIHVEYRVNVCASSRENPHVLSF